jgi:Oligoendopeptidase F
LNIKERKDIPDKYKWSLNDIYKDNQDLEKDICILKEKWEEISKLKDKLSLNTNNLLKGLELRDDILRLSEKIYSFASMQFDQDTRVNESLALFDKALAIYSQSLDALAFFVPELLRENESDLRLLLNQDIRLNKYTHFFDNIIRNKNHILSDKEESIIAQYSEVLMAPENIYSIFNGADLSFPSVKKR